MEQKKENTAIIVSCFSWYEKRLIYIDEYLKNKGFKTYVVLSDFNHINKQYDKHLSWQENINYIHVKPYKKNLSVSRIISHINFANKVADYIDEMSPQIVYALVPPNYLVKNISNIKNRKKFKLVYDVIDLWPESFPLPKANIPPFSIWKNIRNKNINSADMVVLECYYYKEVLRKIVDEEKFRLLYLVKEPLKTMKMEKNIKFEGCVKLAYIGSINNLLDIEKVEWIIKEIRREYLVLVKIIGKGDKTDTFLERIKEAGAEVEYYGAIYDDDKKKEIFYDCHFGLNIYKDNIRVGLTMKSIDYFQQSLPIINSISGDTFNLVKDKKIGINVDDGNFLIELNNILCNINEVKINTNKIFLEKFCTTNINSNLMFLDEICK